MGFGKADRLGRAGGPGRGRKTHARTPERQRTTYIPRHAAAARARKDIWEWVLDVAKATQSRPFCSGAPADPPAHPVRKAGISGRRTHSKDLFSGFHAGILSGVWLHEAVSNPFTFTWW